MGFQYGPCSKFSILRQGQVVLSFSVYWVWTLVPHPSIVRYFFLLLLYLYE